MPSTVLGRPQVRDEAQPLDLLIIDPRSLRRTCMAAGLETADFRVTSSSSLEGHHPLHVPDIVLLQLGDSIQEAALLLDLISRVTVRWPTTPILVIADHGDDKLILSAIAAGAQGVLMSTTSVLDIRKALTLLNNGLAIFPASVARTIQARLKRQGPAGNDAEDGIQSAVEQLAPLTRRQRDVLQLLARGASNKDIAKRLQISESTVKVHVRAIMALNGASNRTQIVAHLLKRGQTEN